MPTRLFSFAIAVLVVTTIVACQQPSDGETPAGSDGPGGGASPGGASPGGASPIAPAIEPSHPDAERTIPLPTSPPPVAPDAEIESRPDPTAPTEPD